MSQPWKLLCKFIIAGDSNVGKSSILVRLTEDRFIMDQDPTIGVEFGSHLIPLENGETIKIQVWDTAGSEQFRSITRSYYRGAAGALLVYSVAHRPSFENVKNWLQDVRSHAEESVSIVLVGNQLDLCEKDDDEEEGDEGDQDDQEGPEDTDDQGQNEQTATRQEDESDSDAKNLSSKRRKNKNSTTTESSGSVQKKSKKKRRQVSTKEAREFAEKEGIMFVETSAKTGQNVEEAFTITAKDIHSKFLSKNPTCTNPNSTEGGVLNGSSNGANGRRSGARANNGSLILNAGEDRDKRACCLLM